MPEPHGPALADAEDVYRAILYPMWWVADGQRSLTAAFDMDCFSVDIALRSTPVETANRFRDVSKIVQFDCGRAREFSFDGRDEPDEAHPDNWAHAHMYFLIDATSAKNARKTHIRRFIEAATTTISLP